MAITGVNNYATYINYHTDITNKQGKTHSNTREYKSYLTEKYKCLRSSDYSVMINSSLLSEALGDEKTKQWLEYNLSLIPETIEKTRSMQAARGCKVLSCTVKINGYDSMTEETLVTDEVDPGTEKARKELEEKIKRIREERKAEERKAEERKLDELVFDSNNINADNVLLINSFDQKI